MLYEQFQKDEKQRKLDSFFEALFNAFIGWLLALLAQSIIYPLYGITITIGENMQIALLFVSISIARNYIIRRWFSKKGSWMEKEGKRDWIVPNTAVASSQTLETDRKKYSFKGSLCNNCNRVWELRWIDNRAQLVSYEDFPTYGLPREVCPECTENISP